MDANGAVVSKDVPKILGMIKCGTNGQGCPCGQVCKNNTCLDVPPKCLDNCDCHDPSNPICHNGVCGPSWGYPDCACGLLCER